MVTSFADGSKISFEQTIVANATGFKVLRAGDVPRPGLRRLDHGHPPALRPRPAPRARRRRRLHGRPGRREDLRPRRAHRSEAAPLPRACTRWARVRSTRSGCRTTWCTSRRRSRSPASSLFGDNLAPPLGGPVVEVCAVAKRDLEAGEVLDEYGMYMTYGEAVQRRRDERGRYLPEGLVEGCRLEARHRQGRGPHLRRRRAARRAASPIGSAPSSTATSAARPGSRSGWRRRTTDRAGRRQLSSGPPDRAGAPPFPRRGSAAEAVSACTTTSVATPRPRATAGGQPFATGSPAPVRSASQVATPSGRSDRPKAKDSTNRTVERARRRADADGDHRATQAERSRRDSDFPAARSPAASADHPSPTHPGKSSEPHVREGLRPHLHS